ncbi:MAG: protein translocase SEC61 complex subunit gamma [DPANN group archaeon]|nr:protein translocase SEC61 complex subunit gamma [DPANN group archaeon]
MDLKNLQERTGSFVTRAIRVMRLTKKPKKQEFAAVAKVTGLGMVVLGAIGYIIMSLGYVFGFV